MDISTQTEPARSFGLDRSTRLLAVADRLQPHQDALIASWGRFEGTLSNDDLAQLKAVVARANEAIDEEAREIADATGNSVHNVRCFSPAVGKRMTRRVDGRYVDSVDPLQVWFDDRRPADFLRNVVRYRSFNQDSWFRSGWGGWAESAEAGAPAALAA